MEEFDAQYIETLKNRADTGNNSALRRSLNWEAEHNLLYSKPDDRFFFKAQARGSGGVFSTSRREKTESTQLKGALKRRWGELSTDLLDLKENKPFVRRIERLHAPP